MTQVKKSRHQPKGFDILHEDLDLIVGNKKAGFLTVAALWNKDDTIHGALNDYIRKGNARSRKSVYVVHRLDQATSGILVFAKTEDVQNFLKDNWKSFTKTYYAVVLGHPVKNKDIIESYLSEDEDYKVHSSKNKDAGKLAKTEYEVVFKNEKYSLIKIILHTGKKNQIRVHMSEIGHPVVGDDKYGKKQGGFSNLALHSYSLELIHPFKKTRMKFTAPIPDYFNKLIRIDQVV